MDNTKERQITLLTVIRANAEARCNMKKVWENGVPGKFRRHETGCPGKLCSTASGNCWVVDEEAFETVK